MRKNNIKFNINVTIIREGDKFIAYSPALDLSTCGNTYSQAKKRFDEIVNIFFEEIIKKRTCRKVLGDLGWQQEKRKLTPPVVVAQEYQTVSMPAFAA